MSNQGAVTCRGFNASEQDTFDKTITYASAGAGLDLNVTTTIGPENRIAYIGGIAGYVSYTRIAFTTNSGWVTAAKSTLTTMDLTQEPKNGLANVKVTVNSGAVVGFGGLVGCLDGNSLLSHSGLDANVLVGFSDTSGFSGYGLVCAGGIVGLQLGISRIGTAPTTIGNTVYFDVGCDDSYTTYLRGAYFVGGIIGYSAGSKALTSPLTVPIFDMYGRVTGETTLPINKHVVNIMANMKNLNVYYENPSQSYFTFNKGTIAGKTIGNIGAMSNEAWYCVGINGSVQEG